MMAAFPRAVRLCRHAARESPARCVRAVCVWHATTPLRRSERRDRVVVRVRALKRDGARAQTPSASAMRMSACAKRARGQPAENVH